MLKNLGPKRLVQNNAQNDNIQSDAQQSIQNIQRHNQDAIIAGRLIDILFQYIDARISKDNWLTNQVWNILKNHVHMMKDWVRQGDVNILLDQFQEELDKRIK